MSEYFVHETSFVDDNVDIGKNTKIWHFSHVLSQTTIGSNCSFGQNCVVGPKVHIGNGVKVQNNISIYEGVEVEDDVFLGPSMVFTNVINPRAFIVRRDEFKKTLLKRGCSIGANATIVCGITIGEYALIGSGAVINKDVKPYALMVGVPARQIGWVGISGNTLEFSDNKSEDEYAYYELVNDNLEVRKKMKIDFANLQYQHNLYKDEIEDAILKVAKNCNFIMGEEVQVLEKSLEEFTGAKYAVSCSSGTDALLLAMMAIDIKPGDEIITTPFTFIATAETIAFLGAKPVFVDIDEKTYNIDPAKIEEKITSKTKAIIPVSLYGQPADMDAIQKIANKHNLKVVIDGAQSFGSTYNGITDSALGDISTTSFFPAKPLGCYGDGGACFTDDEELANKMKSLRVHGQSKRYHHQYIGMGGRLDTIQAAVLNVKLKYYKKDLALRQEVANRYTQSLKNKSDITLPYIDEKATSAWAQYSIRVKNRDKVQEKLKIAGIPTAVHYPKSLHLQECFEYLGYKKGDFPIAEAVSEEIMSLPMNPYVTDEEIEYIMGNL